MVGVTGSIPVVPTIQSSRTGETVVDRKEAVSAGILPPIFNNPGLCRQLRFLRWIFGRQSPHPKIPFLRPNFGTELTRSSYEPALGFPFLSANLSRARMTVIADHGLPVGVATLRSFRVVGNERPRPSGDGRGPGPTRRRLR
jgi:hypothetical protein